MKKKLLSLSLAAAILLSISGCSEEGKIDRTPNAPAPVRNSTQNTAPTESLTSGTENSLSWAEPATEETEDEISEEPVAQQTEGEASETPEESTVKNDESDETTTYPQIKDWYVGQDQGDFIGGIEGIINRSATVEELYQAIEEFDTADRITEIRIYKHSDDDENGTPITAAEGELAQGTRFHIYYDDGLSWFETRKN